MQDVTTRAGTMLQGTASGMIPMAIFTPVYSIWAAIAWPLFGSIFFIITLAISVYFIVSAVRSFKLSRQLPDSRNADDLRISKVMPVLSNIMGVGILVTVLVLVVINAYQWIVPSVMIIVALHFFPMARLFRRTIDYTLGALMLAGAALGFFLLTQDIAWQAAWGSAGVIGAVVTISYGFNAIMSAGQVLSDYRRQAAWA